MKKKWFTNILSFIILTGLILSILLSIYFGIVSISKFSFNNCDFNNEAYLIISEYSGLYKITFVLIALFLTYRQVKLSQENNERTISDILKKQEEYNQKKVEIKTENTLIQCSIYSTSIQDSIKDFTDKGIFNGLLQLRLSENLNPINLKTLVANKTMYNIVFNHMTKHHGEISIFLQRMDSFSIYLLKGNIDFDLCGSIIGRTFMEQSEIWLGFIAYYRNDNNPLFANNILDLRGHWEKFIEKIPESSD